MLKKINYCLCFLFWNKFIFRLLRNTCDKLLNQRTIIYVYLLLDVQLNSKLVHSKCESISRLITVLTANRPGRFIMLVVKPKRNAMSLV